MIRLLSGTAVTESQSFSVPKNRIWKLYSSTLSLTTSSTSGTRSLYLLPYFGQSTISGNAINQISTSTESTTINSTSQIGNQNANSNNIPSPVIFSEFDQIQIDVSLQDGDEYSFWIVVEELEI